MLPPDRLDRFARHIVLPEIGGAGQAALAEEHVALVGIGGIGSPVLQYLAAAGVGSLTLIDDFSHALGVGNNESLAHVSALHPLGHLGEPQNVADAVVFLASDRAAFTTGSELVVDGGMVAG